MDVNSNFMRRRVDLVKEIQGSLKRSMKLSDGAPACFNGDLLANTFGLINKIGSGSINGEAYKVCYPIKCREGACDCSETSINLAVKKIPLAYKDFELHTKPMSEKALQSELWAELFFMKLCKVLVENKITPNLPLYVNYFVCNSCYYENEHLINSQMSGKPCVILINELATAGDLKEWSEVPRNDDLWLNAYFQIFTAIYALQKYFDITHHDLHWGNVLVHEVPVGGFWRYTIDGIDYDVPNYGFLFTLWDFGYARIPGKVEIEKWRKRKYSENENYYEEDSQNPRLLVDYLRISRAPSWRASSSNAIPVSNLIQDFMNGIYIMFQNGEPIQSIISVYGDIYPARQTNNDNILEHYSFDQKLAMDSKLYKFMRSTTRKAYMVPTRQQIDAHKRLHDELKFDLNAPGRLNMINVMKTYNQPPNDLKYDPAKMYKSGEIMAYQGNLFIARIDNPGENDWEYLAPESDMNVSNIQQQIDELVAPDIDIDIDSDLQRQIDEIVAPYVPINKEPNINSNSYNSFLAFLNDNYANNNEQ